MTTGQYQNPELLEQLILPQHTPAQLALDLAPTGTHDSFVLIRHDFTVSSFNLLVALAALLFVGILRHNAQTAETAVPIRPA
jgi:hypothetical protein